jgi:tight adherence protein B
LASGIMLLLAFSMLIGLAGTALLTAEGMAKQRRIATRLARVAPTSAQIATKSPVKIRAKAPGPLSRVASVFGCDWERRHLLPMQWWIALAATCIAGRLAAALVAAMLGDLALLVWPVAWRFVSRMVFKGWSQARRERLQNQFADAIGMIVRTVRAGIPVIEGLRLVGREADEPTRSEFRQLSEQISIGVPLDEAVLAMAERTGMTEYRFLASTVILQSQTGGGLSEALENLAEVVRRRVALRARGFALTSEARTSGKVLLGLPFLSGGMMMFLTPAYMDPLISTQVGHECLGVAALSLITGALVMRSMIRSVLS